MAGQYPRILDQETRPMNRSDWLRQVRRTAEERMDTLFAAIYDDNWGATIEPSHQRMMSRFLSLCPPRGAILDAACGTGKYWPTLLAGGRTVHGVDQSQGMLDRARAKFPDVPTENVGLQELGYGEAFDAAICMDALENVCPEGWPLVLTNLHRALKPAGCLYFTVELAEQQEVEAAYAAGRQRGLPLVAGEWVLLEGGYHYYPRIERVREWARLAQFRPVEETIGDFYHHFLVRKD